MTPDLRACDIPGAVVGMAFREARDDCALLRVRHVEARGCGGMCTVDLLLTWAFGVFDRWSAPDIGADDLQAAVMILRSMA